MTSVTRYIIYLLVISTTCLRSEPQLTSWYTEKTGKYARIFTSKGTEASNTSAITWSRGQGIQNSPTYAGIHEIYDSDDWVYIKTTGLGFHVMGPWYLNEAKTRNFPNFPSNTATTYRVPKIPSSYNGNVTTSAGAIGYFVDGVALFDATDTFSYITSSGTDGSPIGGGRGDGVWNRDAYVNEGVTFDAALAHQAMNLHHYHANAPAVRHLLGGSVDYNESTNIYTENFNGSHSPILGWVADGHPVYGPYAYDEPNNPDSGIRRMISGYQKRDGTNGSTNLNSTGRRSLPRWVSTLEGRSISISSNRYGPNVSNQYILGHYLEDYAYKGHLGLIQGKDYDLDEHNGRFCVTPEFPEGIWAYFTTVEDDGIPVFPYNVGRNYYGTPSGGRVNAVPAQAVKVFSGGPNKQHKAKTVNASGNVVTFVWDTVEGASYRVDASSDLKIWHEGNVAFTADSTNKSSAYNKPSSGADRFYRMIRTGIEDFDNNGFSDDFGDGPDPNDNNAGGGGPGGGPGGRPNPTGNDLVVSPEKGDAGSTVVLQIRLTIIGGPPNFATPQSVSIGEYRGTNISRNSANGIISARVRIPNSAETGKATVFVRFGTGPRGEPPLNLSLINGFEIE
ncbi:MAG: YHYH protein [Verrucomicrobiales bacterium]|nr:YHYH protein [Verrucomicrobiales bacterium]